MESSRLLEKLSGLFIPLCTPFSPDEKVCYKSLRFNLEYYAQTEILGYLALGSNGENKSLTEKEKLAVLNIIIKYKGSKKVVIVGVMYEAQKHAEIFLRQAADLGADFGLLLPPSYFRKQMTDDILYNYYITLADVSPIPILIYNAPGFCNINISPDLVRRLCIHPNIVGIKDSAPSGIEDFLALANEKFYVLAGSANFLFSAMMNGAVGGIVSLANSLTHFAIQLFKYGATHDEMKGVPIQEKACRINKAISVRYGVSGVKAAMNLCGLRGGIPRRPLLPLTKAQIDEMQDILIKEGVLGANVK